MQTYIVQVIVPVVLAAPTLIAQTIQVDVAGIYFPSEPFASDVFPSINDGEDWSISMTMQVVPDIVDPINGQMVYYGVVNSYALTFNEDTFFVNDVPDPLSQIAINIGHPRDLFTISVV